MKPNRKDLFLAASAAITVALAQQAVHAQTNRYWDGNNGTTGFGNAGGTWASPTTGTATSGWSSSSTGVTAINGNSVTTALTDILHFGTDTSPNGLGSGTITISGTVDAATLRFGNQTTGNIVLSGGTINLAASATIHVGAGSTTVHTISSSITGAGTSLTKTGNTLQLSANNSFTGQTIISSGTLILNNATVLGGNTPGTNGTSSISMGANSTLQSNYAPADLGITDSYVYAPITLTAAGTNNFFIGNGSSAAPAESVRLNLNGAIGGTAGANVVFGNTTSGRNNADSIIVLGAASTYNGNTTIQAGNSQNKITVISGAVNALPTTTVLSFDSVAGSGSGRFTTYDLNGNNQTLAGLSNGGLVGGDRNIRISSTAAATLTINNTADFTFGGAAKDSETGGTSGTTTSAQVTGAISLVKNGTGTFTLGGTLTAGTTGAPTAQGNAFTGTTKILGGILVLGESLSIQNSAFDTTSIIGGASDGLRAGIGGTGVTTLTLGGLTGGNNFSTRFTSTTGGYANLTNLTLNPGTGATPSYAGDVGNGNGSMTLTKTGLGTQTLAVAQTYSGGTFVSAGTLALSGTGTLGASGTALTLNGGSVDLGTLSQTVGAVSVTAAAASGDTIGNGSLTGTSYAASNASGNAIISANLLVNGAAGFTKTGAGSVTLSGANTYTGTTAINVGSMVLSGSGTLGNGAALTLGGGSLNLGALSRTVGAVSITAPASSGDTISNGSLTGTSYAASHTTGTAIISANLLANGAAGFALSGAGSVTLSGNNTYSGGTSVTSTGVLNLAHSNAAGSGTISLASTQASTGQTMTLSGGINVANDIQIDATTGRENITSSSGSNTLSGNVTINGNSTNIQVFQSAGASATTFTVGGATPNSTTITASTFSGQISFRSSAADRLGVINSQFNTPNAIADFNTFGVWTINSTGNNWGTTQISSSGGLNLKLGANDALDTGALVNFSNAAGNGLLDLNGKNQQVAGVAGGNTTTPTVHIRNTGAVDSTLTLAGLTANRSFAGIIADGGTNKTSLVMDSAGRTQTLSGANTYTGATLVSAGTLFVTGSLTSNVTVSDTATVGGGGTVGDISFAGGSFFDIALAVGGTPDSLTTGAISFAAAGFGVDNLVFNGAAVDWTTVADGTYTLLTGTLNSLNLDNFGLANAAPIGGGRSAYFQSGSLQLVVIPEPNVAALIGALGGILLLRRRR